ncbi:DUF397 domain-containing protein [Actinomadura sp. GC306]|uniref:DUF397 domain-containing protein n=1 Tax=Actinomadura sp. GC306 TaxID=2530367 RepID=UPI001FB722BB|nr:DUF397 domain-containing protein [Actinomadura sp. GC306]
MSNLPLAQAVFRKSSYSDGGNGCVETCVLGSRRLVRDSKNPEGGVLALERDVWAAVVSRIKQGAYDL